MTKVLTAADLVVEALARIRGVSARIFGGLPLVVR